MIRWGLMTYLWQKTKKVTLMAMAAWLGAVLLPRSLLTAGDSLPVLIVMLQAAALAVALGRYQRGEFGFLYTRGFGRDALAGHTMLVALASAMVPILIAAVVVWSGVRSSVQDVTGNPLFPVAAGRETLVPWVWLALCMVLVPAAQYAWIRLASAFSGRMAGVWLALAIVVGLFCVANIRFHLDGRRLGLAAVAGIGIFLAIMVAARAAHRELEVRA